MSWLEFLLELNLSNIKIQRIKKYVEMHNLDQKLADHELPSLRKSTTTDPSRLTAATVNRVIGFFSKLVTSTDLEESVVIIKAAEKRELTKVKVQCLWSRAL